MITTLRLGFLAAAGLALAAFVPPAAAQPHDPWIGSAFREVLHRDPRGSEWNIQNYGHGHWSSYQDLVNKVRVRMTGVGAAYIFIKPEQAVRQGHIGWGFLMADGRYCFGSTENPMKAGRDLGQDARAVWDALTINPGADNGFWYGIADTEQEMLNEMKRPTNTRQSDANHPYGDRCSGYWHYKMSYVRGANPSAALGRAESCRESGFKGIGWNCLDQTYAILEAYGVDKNNVMPWKQTHPSPNYWFNDFGHQDPVTGATYKGNNTSGYPL